MASIFTIMSTTTSSWSYIIYIPVVQYMLENIEKSPGLNMISDD